jgi:acetyltransferase-like isoleucine patch superfamily enzyme
LKAALKAVFVAGCKPSPAIVFEAVDVEILRRTTGTMNAAIEGQTNDQAMDQSRWSYASGTRLPPAVAPIALFVYNRPYHTRRTVQALQENELAAESDLFIFSDAAKKPDAMSTVKQVRDYIRTISGFRTVNIVERERNLGLANSIAAGVTQLCEAAGRAIVLEDDLVTAPFFLRYMNDALDRYADQPNVYSVSGHSFTNDMSDVDSTYFLRITSSWGWATWGDKWRIFERNRAALAESLRAAKDRKRFNYQNSYDFSALAESQLAGKSDSWAIYWYFCVHRKNGLTLYPRDSLIQNIGRDGSGTHSGEGINDSSVARFKPVLTEDIFEKEHIRSKVQGILRQSNPPVLSRGLVERGIWYIKRRLRNESRIRIDQIGEAARLLFSKRSIGRDTFVDKTVQVLGWDSVSIGNSSVIGERSWLNVNNRRTGRKHIVIGNNCWIGMGNIFSAGVLIYISDYCMTAMGCKFLGVDHAFEDPQLPYIVSGLGTGKTIRLGVNVWLGADVTVVGDVSIGHGSIIGAGALVTQDIPPFSIAVGNPCRVRKRYDFLAKAWIRIEEYQHEHDAAMPGEEEYLKTLMGSHPNIAMPLQAASRDFGDMF